uniref:Uncharacterized protein n=1 Tax=Rhizophora mucronata TaxID=61149 RepID=A0A2P2J6J2_RHIMU
MPWTNVRLVILITLRYTSFIFLSHTHVRTRLKMPEKICLKVSAFDTL